MFTIEEGRAVLQAQPFSRLLGTELTEVDADERAVTLQLDLRDELRQQHGFLHGGVIAYLADNALTFAGGLVLGPSVLTGSVNLDYLRPVSAGPVRARATVVEVAGRTAICAVQVSSADDVCAVAQGRVRLVG
ncbi:hypothetical protein GCM10011492_16210 [Flexivirga endophytica]|uniref:Medium/long-chain acyl-CoA thioesterase YigI n=1 Tax=Flexivirga endophytica TaxID=1849103 RepID=A0A916T220_9MICO|nr:PaaI family thioesterase [Flexivirga endophytica]GGB26701.1 hypothetical protein GCM10011492_16210 [Flexivirga endophytica]GHB55182.1 hypothetical protein GCM10008112_25520 [Flexivirga endophytica]